MKKLVLMAAGIFTLCASPSALAQGATGRYLPNGMPRYVGNTNQLQPYMMNTPVYNPYYNPYAGFPYNPYNSPVYYGYPQPMSNGLFNIGLGRVNINLWRAPSGYYYPWCNPSGYTSAQIIYAPQGATQSTPQLPPLSTMFTDLNTYLDEQKDKGKLADADYSHLRQRSKDLQTKAGSLRTAGEGVLDPQDEAQIRKDLDSLSTEVAQRVKI